MTCCDGKFHNFVIISDLFLTPSPNEDTTEEDIFKLIFIPALAEPCVDSEAESSDVDSDDSDIREWSRQTEKFTLNDGSRGWTSWCSVL